MVYAIKSPKGQAIGGFVTWDGKVVRATESWTWTIGKSIQTVIAWLNQHYMTWEIV